MPQFPSTPSLIGPYPTFKKPGHLTPPYPSKPVYEAGTAVAGEEFEYEGHNQFIDKKQIADAVQQHVHHHYHHSEAGQNNPSLSYGQSDGPGIGIVGSPSGLSSSGSLGAYNPGFSDLDAYKKAFKVHGSASNNDANGLAGSESTGSYAERYPLYETPTRDTFYGKSDSQKTGKYLAGGSHFSGNAVRGQGVNNDYPTVGFTATNNYNYYGDKNQKNHNNVNQYFGNDFSASYAPACVCVPYEQCSGNEHAGRKDDLFLAIDPRNLNKNIEADNSDGMAAVVRELGNGTSTIIRVSKESDADSSATPVIPAIPTRNARRKRETGSVQSTSIQAQTKALATEGVSERNYFPIIVDRSLLKHVLHHRYVVRILGWLNNYLNVQRPRGTFSR